MESCLLGDLINLQSGHSFRSNDYTENGHFLVRIGNVQEGFLSLDKPIYVLLSEKTKRFELNAGDLLTSLTGNIGRVAKVESIHLPAALNQRVARMTVSDKSKLSNDYFYYFLQSSFFRDRLATFGHGAAQQNVSPKAINNLDILLPSLSEQKRIVTILDEVFADIGQARTNIEQNLKNARELFESYLQQVFSQRGEDWIETNLGCIAEFKNGLNFSQSSKGEKLKVVGVKDFKSNFMVPFEQLETIQIDGDLSKAYELKENDIIIVRSNGNKRLIGRCLLMGTVDNKTSYSGFTIRIRLSNKNISPKFLAYYLKSSSTHELLINSGEGANISNLNQKILNSLPIAFPHFDKQIQLTDAIEKVEQESQELEKVYANKLILIEELKKSILQKAFTGELTK